MGNLSEAQDRGIDTPILSTLLAKRVMWSERGGYLGFDGEGGAVRLFGQVGSEADTEALLAGLAVDRRPGGWESAGVKAWGTSELAFEESVEDGPMSGLLERIEGELTERKRGAETNSITRVEKTKANAALRKAGFDGKGRWKSAGAAATVAFEVLNKWGIEPDEVFTAHRYGKDKGHESIPLARSTSDPFSPIPISNSALAFQWTKLDTGFEVIAYLG